MSDSFVIEITEEPQVYTVSIQEAADGFTPQLRAGVAALESSSDEGDTWQTLITYSGLIDGSGILTHANSWADIQTFDTGFTSNGEAVFNQLLSVNSTAVFSDGIEVGGNVQAGTLSSYDTIQADGDITTGGDLFVGDAIHFASLGTLRGTSDGVFRFLNNATSDFNRLQLGGTTSAFPAIKRNSTAINIRLADDSADAPLTASKFNKVTITTPATGSTLTVADGKTFTTSNTLTLSGTDGSTLAIGTGGTLGTAAYTSASTYATLAGGNSFTGTQGFTLTGSQTFGIACDNTITLTSGSGIFLTATGGSSTSITGSVKLASLTSNGIVTTSGSNGTLGITTTLPVTNGGTGQTTLSALKASIGFDFQSVVATGTDTRTSTTTFTDDAELVGLTMVAGGLYRIEWVIGGQAAGAVGLAIQLTFPATSNTGTVYQGSMSKPTSASLQAVQLVGSATTLAINSGGTVVPTGWFNGHVIMQVGASGGTLGVQLAQGASSATTVSRLPGSQLRLYRLN